jgi:hypothetical protein
MSLTIQTINVTTTGFKQLSCTMPAEHIYPFIIHRSVDEYLAKKSGERTRYTKKHVVSHLLSGCQLGVFPNYENALAVVRKLKDKPIFLMPTYDLLSTHPDKAKIHKLVAQLKHRYEAIEEF